jgi:ABC-type sugar transport system substrate-binding protein
MKNTGKRFLFALLVMLIATGGMLFAAAQQEAAGGDEIEIVYVGYATSNTFWNRLGAMAEEQAGNLGIKFTDLTPPEPNPSEQKKAVDNAILQKVDGIIIGAADNRAFGESLDKAKAAGIPVVAVDTGIDHEQVFSLVQTDNLSSARVAGQYIVDNMKPGKVLILGGTLGHQTGNARRDGVKQVAEENGIEVIFRACDWDETKAFETTQNELAANPDITAIFSAWDPGAMSAKAVVKDKGLLDDIIIVGFDGNPANLKAIKAGEIEATIKQDNDKMGYDSVQVLLDIINGKSVDSFYPIDGFIIDASNVDDYL